MFADIGHFTAFSIKVCYIGLRFFELGYLIDGKVSLVRLGFKTLYHTRFISQQMIDRQIIR